MSWPSPAASRVSRVSCAGSRSRAHLQPAVGGGKRGVERKQQHHGGERDRHQRQEGVWPLALQHHCDGHVQRNKDGQPARGKEGAPRGEALGAGCCSSGNHGVAGEAALGQVLQKGDARERSGGGQQRQQDEERLGLLAQQQVPLREGARQCRKQADSAAMRRVLAHLRVQRCAEKEDRLHQASHHASDLRKVAQRRHKARQQHSAVASKANRREDHLRAGVEPNEHRPRAIRVPRLLPQRCAARRLAHHASVARLHNTLVGGEDSQEARGVQDLRTRTQLRRSVVPTRAAACLGAARRSARRHVRGKPSAAAFRGAHRYEHQRGGRAEGVKHKARHDVHHGRAAVLGGAEAIDLALRVPQPRAQRARHVAEDVLQPGVCLQKGAGRRGVPARQRAAEQRVHRAQACLRGATRVRQGRASSSPCTRARRCLSLTRALDARRAVTRVPDAKACGDASGQARGASVRRTTST